MVVPPIISLNHFSFITLYALCFSAIAFNATTRPFNVPLSTVAKPEIGAFKPPNAFATKTSLEGRFPSSLTAFTSTTLPSIKPALIVKFL